MGWYYDFFPRSTPRQAKGGIKAQTRSGQFGKTWWAKRWIAVLESFNIGARLSRGRSYARKGQVLSIEIDKGEVSAQVQGSRPKPYDVSIQIKVLYADDEGLTTALFKLAPGAVVPLHEHTALEQTYVLEGRLTDHEGECGPGQFVWRPAGNQHEAVAPEGALILGFFLKPNRFAYGEKFFTEKEER